MDRLLGMGMFTKVVELGGFSRAAERLQVSNAAVTNVINKLEAHLGVRLLHRTTRSLSLTDDGAAFYESCKRILADVEETEAALSHPDRPPRAVVLGGVQRPRQLPTCKSPPQST